MEVLKAKKKAQELFLSLPLNVRAHGIRVGLVTSEMAKRCAAEHSFFGMGDERTLRMAILDAGQYHDIGKIMISNSILAAGGMFTPAERLVYINHPLRGEEIIRSFDDVFFVSGAHKKIMLDMATYHHERHDARGFPYELSGDEIPFIAQLCAVADFADNLAHKTTECGAIRAAVKENSGSLFNPRAVEVFEETFADIKKLYREKEDNKAWVHVAARNV